MESFVMQDKDGFKTSSLYVKLSYSLILVVLCENTNAKRNYIMKGTKYGTKYTFVYIVLEQYCPIRNE